MEAKFRLMGFKPVTEFDKSDQMKIEDYVDTTLFDSINGTGDQVYVSIYEADILVRAHWWKKSDAVEGGWIYITRPDRLVYD